MRPLRFSHSSIVDRKVSEAIARLNVAYVPLTELPAFITTPGLYPMAVCAFGRGLTQPVSCPLISPDLPQIGGLPLAEVWFSDIPVQIERVDHCVSAMNGECVIMSISLTEQAGKPLDDTTYQGYSQALRQLHNLGYPYLWRAWNYFPRINGSENGLERYRRFCVGRHQAMVETFFEFPGSLPAATAVGTRSGPLQLILLAGSQSAQHFGNPRQLNAYEYPREYGPRSPSFARATICRSETEGLLFIAGTASVVGHTSRHIGLPYEQARETIQNLRTLFSHVREIGGAEWLVGQPRSMYKVYLRNPDLLPEVSRALEGSPLADQPVLFLQGELCRKDLLVEMEALLFSD